MKVALCVNDDYKDLELNSAYMEEKIIEASYNGADIIIFPNHSFNVKLYNTIKENVENLEGIDEILKDLTMFAQSYAICLVFGYDYFDGEMIKKACKVISYEGKELENNFYLEGKSFSLNNDDGEFVIALDEKKYLDNKKVFYVNKYYKDENSGGAYYYFKEIIKEIEENKENMIYIVFE